jgi:hypothetical protein
MGFLDRFFRPKQETLSIKEANRLFLELEAKKREELSKEKQRLAKELEEAKARLRAALLALNSAKLLNENIPARERNIMEGNRKAYSNQVELLIQGLSSLPEPAEFQVKLEGFLKASLKSYQILMHFFETEARGVAAELKALEGIVEEYKKALYLKAELAHLRDLFDQYYASVKNRKRKAEAQKEENARLQSLKAEKQRLVAAKTKLEASQENKEYEAQKQNAKRLHAMQHGAELKVYQNFARFSKYLRKYHNLMDDGLAIELIETPVKTFRAEPELTIKLFSNLIELIERNQISAKDKVKLLERLRGVNWEQLKGIVEEMEGFSLELEKVEKQVENHPIGSRFLELELQEKELNADILKEEQLLAELFKLKPASKKELIEDIGARLSKLSGRVLSIG